MHRIFALIVILSLTLSACASTPSIWGVPPTPTAGIATQEAPLFDPFAVQDDPIIFPTSTPPALLVADNTNTPTPDGAAPVIEPTYTASAEAAPYLYYAQSGDMLSAIAKRFGVEESEITSDADLTKTTLIDPGTLLVIPNKINEATTPT